MTDQAAQLDDALEQVIAAARAHLAAVKVAAGTANDEAVWRSYVALNNASFAYDELLLDQYGEVTPWEIESIELRTDAEEPPYLTEVDLTVGDDKHDDPYPTLVSVRQRRDYRVRSTTALLAVAEQAARRLALADEDGSAPETMAQAVLELVRDGDTSLAGLDVPELQPLAGVVTVAEVERPLDPAEDGTGLFRIGAEDRQVGRFDEPGYDIAEERRATGPPGPDG